MLNLDFLSIPLLTASGLVFISLIVGLFSKRVGFSFLLAFLATGILGGNDGPLGLEFSDYVLSFWVGNIALVIILLDGGVKTDFATFRTGLKPALVLATIGVLLTSFLTATAGVLFLKLSWLTAMLLGSVVGSTDAAAVFSLLNNAGVKLNERVATTLEIESGMNDPMAVFLTLTLIGLVNADNSASNITWFGYIYEFLKSLVLQFGWGVVLGILIAVVFAWVMEKSKILADAPESVQALLIASAALTTFSLVMWIGGSGFLAVYLFGITLNYRAEKIVQAALSALDGYAWLSQASMFLLLGLLANPSSMGLTFWAALAVALFMMVLARPLAVWSCLAPMRFTRNEMGYISWVGLRGAVPIVLAIFPFMAKIPEAQLIFNVAFIVVLISLVLQGSTIGWFAKKMGVALPSEDNEKAMRTVYGDFTFAANTPVAELCEFYDLNAPENAYITLEAWIAEALKRPLVVGDHAMLGNAELSVRSMHKDRVLTVGLKLPSKTSEDLAINTSNNSLEIS